MDWWSSEGWRDEGRREEGSMANGGTNTKTMFLRLHTLSTLFHVCY